MVDQRSTGAQPYQQKTHDGATSAEATTFTHRMNGKGLQIFPSSLNASLTTSYGLTNSGNTKQIKQIKQYCCYDNMQRAGAVASLAPCLQQGPINLHFWRNSTVKTCKNSQLILEGFQVRKPSKTLKHNKNATIATSCSKIQWRLVWPLASSGRSALDCEMAYSPAKPFGKVSGCQDLAFRLYKSVFCIFTYTTRCVFANLMI